MFMVKNRNRNLNRQLSALIAGKAGLSNKLNSDVKPQYVVAGVATQTVINTFKQEIVPTGLNASVTGGAGGEFAMVLEILKIYSWLSSPGFTVGAKSVAYAQISKSSQTAILSAENRDLIFSQTRELNYATAASQAAHPDAPFIFDMTDGNGNGYLVAVDNLYISVNSANSAAAQLLAFPVKILGRYKKVSLHEFAGILKG